MNKSYILGAILVISVVCIGYIFINKEDEVVQKAVVSKPIKEKVPEVEIVYEDEEKAPVLPKNVKKVVTKEVEVKEIVYPEVQLEKTKDEAFIITQTRDSGGRFSIKLTSLEKPSNKDILEKRIILKGSFEASEEYSSKFLLTVPPSLLEDIELLNLEISDAMTGQKISESAYCLQSLDVGYDYDMYINTTSGFDCYTVEANEAIKLPKPSKETLERFKKVFEEHQKNVQLDEVGEEK